MKWVYLEEDVEDDELDDRDAIIMMIMRRTNIMIAAPIPILYFPLPLLCLRL